jgi:cell division protein FtsW (lipid II flippase)
MLTHLFFPVRGVELVMYFATLQSYKRSRKKRLFYVLYSTVLLILITIDTSTDAVWGEQMWITFRDMPGGPSAFIAQDLSVWYQILGSTAAVALIFLGDALLVRFTDIIVKH